MPNICVYCGSNPGQRPEFAAAARELGTLLARRGLGLVYGGGNVGLMGTLAEAALAGGAEVIGVIPEDLVQREVAHEGLTTLHQVTSMHERKSLMCGLADGFIAMPGGFGTLDEIMEMITWRQLGYHRKNCGLLNVAGYYDDLLRFLDSAAQAGLILPQHRGLVIAERSADRLLDRILEPVDQASPVGLVRP
jgi:uncharacterized protein (TIGR00730 family)